MTPEQIEAFRKQREERMKNMTPEERAAAQFATQVGLGRSGVGLKDAARGYKGHTGEGPAASWGRR